MTTRTEENMTLKFVARSAAAALLLLLPPARADMKELSWSPGDIAHIRAELEKSLAQAPAGTTSVSRRLMLEQSDKNHYILMVHRNGSGPAELHDTKTDLYVTLAGEGETLVGGKMPADRKELEGRPGEWRGSKLHGGVAHRMRPGHLIDIPAKTPHQVIVAPGKTLTFLIVKIAD